MYNLLLNHNLLYQNKNQQFYLLFLYDQYQSHQINHIRYIFYKTDYLY